MPYKQINIRCRYCDKIEKINGFSNDIKDRMLSHIACFDCAYWLEKMYIYDPSNEINLVIENQHFIVGESKASLKGFGGAKFTIKHKNGKIIETDNLWSQGNIPKIFKDFFENNADFVSN